MKSNLQIPYGIVDVKRLFRCYEDPAEETM